MIVELTVNGATRRLQARSGDRLVDVLRNELALESLMSDCLSGRCGKCFIFLDGRLVHSCIIPAFKAKGCSITTFEALRESDEVKDITAGMEKAEAIPCRFCRIAKIMAIADLLARKSLPEKAEILEQLDMASCSCTDPESLVDAVLLAAEIRNERKFRRANK